MALDAEEVAVRVGEAIKGITEAHLAVALTRCLVPPRACLLDWDYGHPHKEFPEPRYPAFIVAEFPEMGTAIAYSEYGFGPYYPWGVVLQRELHFGMDACWYRTVDAAFRASGAWGEAPPPGYEVD